MNAGAINISVTATMEDFDRKMAAVRANAERAAANAGKGFSKAFQQNTGDLASKVAGQLQNQIRAAFGASAISNALKAAMTEAADGADLGTSIAAGIKAIPIIGAVASAVEQGLATAIGLPDVEKEMASAQALAARSAKQLETAEERAKRLRMAELDLRIQGERDLGNERAAAQFEAHKQILALELQREKDIEAAQQSGRKGEIKFINELFHAERKVIVSASEARMAKIDEEEERKKTADEERARREEERLQKEADDYQIMLSGIAEKMTELRERDRKEREAAMQEIAEAEQKAESDRRAAASAGVGSTATALGTFTFDAYPAAEKKRNDERIVKGIESMRDKIGGFA